MDTSKAKLGDVLSETKMCPNVVQQAIKNKREKQAKQIKAGVDVLKQQASRSYQAIINHVQKLERRHSADIDKVYQQIEKKVAQLKIKQQTTEAAICNMRSYTQQLELKVNVYDCITNVKSFVDRCNKTNTECKNLAEVRLDVVVNWEECHVGVQGVTMNISEGDIEAEGGDIKQFTPFMTQYQGHGASGIATWRDHLMVVHYEHDMIYIYDNNMVLRNSVKVACMKSPWGLCLVQKEPKTQYLVVADSFDNCLWWLRVEEKIGQSRVNHKNILWDIRQIE